MSKRGNRDRKPLYSSKNPSEAELYGRIERNDKRVRKNQSPKGVDYEVIVYRYS